MVQDDRLLIHGDEHLQRHLFEIARVPVAHILEVVVAVDEELPAIQSRQIPIIQLCSTKGYITQDEDDIVVLPSFLLKYWVFDS